MFRLATAPWMAMLVFAITWNGSVHAQHNEIGLPTVEAVEQAVAVEDEAQTLGRSCYALLELVNPGSGITRDSKHSPPQFHRTVKEYVAARDAMLARYLALRRPGHDETRFHRMCSGGVTARKWSSNPFEKELGLDHPPPSRDELKALLTGWALEDAERWERSDAILKQYYDDKRRAQESGRSAESLELLVLLLGVGMLFLGIAGIAFISRRSFNRRNQYGVETFDSYSQMVGSNLLELIIGWLSAGLIVLGLLFMILS